jgi:hypothetical protein
LGELTIASDLSEDDDEVQVLDNNKVKYETTTMEDHDIRIFLPHEAPMVTQTIDNATADTDPNATSGRQSRTSRANHHSRVGTTRELRATSLKVGRRTTKNVEPTSASTTRTAGGPDETAATSAVHAPGDASAQRRAGLEVRGSKKAMEVTRNVSPRPTIV